MTYNIIYDIINLKLTEIIYFKRQSFRHLNVTWCLRAQVLEPDHRRCNPSSTILLVVWIWASYLLWLCLCFFIFKLGLLHGITNTKPSAHLLAYPLHLVQVRHYYQMGLTKDALWRCALMGTEGGAQMVQRSQREEILGTEEWGWDPQGLCGLCQQICSWGTISWSNEKLRLVRGRLW